MLCYVFFSFGFFYKIWLMLKSDLDETLTQTSKCMQTKDCCFSCRLSLFTSSPSASISPNILVSPHFSILPSAFAPLPQTHSAPGRCNRKWDPKCNRPPRAGWRSLRLPCGSASVDVWTSRDVCVYQLHKNIHKGVNFLLPLIHVKERCNCCFVLKSSEIRIMRCLPNFLTENHKLNASSLISLQR